MSIGTLCTDPFLQTYLKNKGIQAQVFDALLTPADKQAMLEALHDFASHWFMDSHGNDYTEYRGVSIGSAIRDEIMTLFCLWLHMDRIMRQCQGRMPSHVYQSASCEFPPMVEKYFAFLGCSLATENIDYPYFSFKKFRHYYIRNNLTYIPLAVDGDTTSRFTIRIIIKNMIKAGLIKLLNLAGANKPYFYCQVLRRLVPFYQSYFTSGAYKKTGLRLILNSRKIPDKDSRRTGIFGRSFEIIMLLFKGVRPEMITPIGPWEAEPSDSQKSTAFKTQVLAEFKKVSASLLSKLGLAHGEFFEKEFTLFLSNNLLSFAGLIDVYYKKFENKNFFGSVQEVVPSLQMQVMARCKKRTVLVPPNQMLHNQYMTAHALKKTQGYVKVIALSDYDKTRYMRLGFNQRDIIVDDKLLLDRYNDTLRPFKPMDNFKNKKVLVIPPFIYALDTFRHLYDSRSCITYFRNLFSVLNRVGCIDVIVRQHPGVDKTGINNRGYTMKHFFQKLLDNIMSSSQFSFSLSYSDSLYNRLAQDVEKCDIVIGTISGTIMESLVLGRDYIVYDQSVAPFPGKLEGSIVHDGIIKRCTTMKELEERVFNYEPIDRDALFKKHYPALLKKPSPKRDSYQELLKLFMGQEAVRNI